MKLKGIALFFLHCQPDRQREFNYWYDTDHVPENRALSGIFHAQRYVAPAEYVALRESNDLEEGGGTYLTVYFTEKEVSTTREGMTSLAARLREQGRFINFFHSSFGGGFRAEAVAARPEFPLTPGAIPTMPHQGVYIILDEVLDKAQEQRLIDWYDKVHTPDTLKCHGFAAGFRFRCLAPGYENRILHYFFLDDNPLSAAKERKQRLLDLQEQGRMLDFSGLAHRIFAGPYRTIIPLQYDFLVS